VTLPFTGLNDPERVAVDSFGDVFVTDAGNNRVLELPVAIPTSLSATPAVLETNPIGLPLFMLSATLTRATTGMPIPGQLVAFVAHSNPLCSATTNTAGTASCSVLANLGDMLQILLANGYTASFAGQASYLPSQGSAPLIR
jgi:hypothetical protein